MANIFEEAAAEGERIDQEQRKQLVKRFTLIGKNVERRLTVNPNDPTVEAVEQLLGIKEGGLQGVLEKLGVKTSDSNADSDGPRALESPKEKPLPVFNDDGTPAGVALREEQARSYGYAFKLDSGGNVEGWIKPPANAGSAHPQPAGDDDRKVDVLNRRGDKVKEVSVSRGKADKALSQITDGNHSVIAFQEKPRFAFGR
jgi:hypothetical protein